MDISNFSKDELEAHNRKVKFQQNKRKVEKSRAELSENSQVLYRIPREKKTNWDSIYSRVYFVKREDNAILKFLELFTDTKWLTIHKQLPVFSNILRHRTGEQLRDRLHILSKYHPNAGFLIHDAYHQQKENFLKFLKKIGDTRESKKLFEFDDFVREYYKPEYC